ncbi:MAG: hypothetical protein AAF533_19640 [Acidobacteriota bacterium]
MIRVERERVAEPAALSKRYSRRSKSPRKAGLTEREAVEALAVKLLEAGGGDEVALKELAFKYERYREGQVKVALRSLFFNKCAYCESSYAGTQPMDVEHWRPKSEVHLSDGTVLRPGYYWLAADWRNLFPSCIDCNRSRKQHDVVDDCTVALGKANQFPVQGDAHVLSHVADLEDEAPLLIDPCGEDDPEDFFRYTEDGVVVPRAEDGLAWERALASIRVYALNRSELVAERLALRRLLDHRLDLIDQLGRLRDRLDAPDQAGLRDALGDLIASEIDALLAMTGAEQPYAGLARQFIRDAELRAD